MIVGTKYDKELKEKVFYVREVDSYTHKTTTNLTVDWVDGVFTLTAVVSNIIGKGFVKFYRDGVEVGEQYVSKTATLLLQSETNTGVFVAKFMGNSDCLKSQSSEVSYSPLPVPEFSLTVDKDTGVVGDTLTFTPHLSEGVTGSIVYTVDGAEYTKNVGETFTYKFNKSGSFTVSAVYSGDETHQGATASVSVKINKHSTHLTCTVDKNSVTVGENVLCTLYLKDNQNNPLANKTVYCEDLSETTNEEGRVIFNYANPSTGEVTKVFKFDGDNLYNSASVTANWTVNKKPVNITVTVDKTSVTVGETVTLTATVKSDGVNVNEGKVDFGDGVLVDVSNGTAVRTFTKTTPTVLTVTPSYKGTSTYTTATASSLTLTWVEEQVTPEISISASTLIGEVGDDLPITLSSNLKNTALTVLLNDAEVADSVTTDNSGNAVFNYNCNGAGDVNVKVKYLSGTDVYYSNILNLEDCFIYGFKGDETFSLRSGYIGTLNISYTANNELKFTASSRVLALMDKSFTTSENWVVEFDMKATGYDGGRIGIQRKDGSSPEKSCVALKPQSNITYANLSKSETTTSTDTNIGGYSSYNHYKIIAKDGKTSLYRDNISKVSVENNDWLDKEICLYLHGWTNSSVIYIKNFKAKVYLE